MLKDDAGQQAIVTARLFGGLGNQLFIYATAKAVALRTDATLALDVTSGYGPHDPFRRQYLLGYFQGPACCPTTIVCNRRFRYALNAMMPFGIRKYVRESAMNGLPRFDERLLRVRRRPSLVLEGYWQSEKYFVDVERHIKDDLRGAIALSREARGELEQIQSGESCAICVRSFAEVSGSAAQQQVPRDFYAAAIAMVLRKAPQVRFFLFSDKPSWAWDYLVNVRTASLTGITARLNELAAYEDLLLIRACTHHIIGNSSFHWWGAWLGDSGDGLTIAPGGSFRNADTIPARWVSL